MLFPVSGCPFFPFLDFRVGSKLILICGKSTENLYFREIMHAMWKPQKFKYIYLMATLYVFTLTIPSATAVYWAFGDQLLNHSNAFSLLPKNGFRDAAVILMLIHQVVLLNDRSLVDKNLFYSIFGFYFAQNNCTRKNE